MLIDSHQHFWIYDEQAYPWIPKGTPLHRDWLPKDIEPLLAKAGIDGCVAVQARQTVGETHWLLTLADHAPMIKGVVGWIDLQSEAAEEQLAELATRPKFVGARHVVQDEPDENFMLRPNFLRGLGKLARHSLTYDILIYPKQLPAAIALTRKFPEQLFVLDHIAKPFIKDGVLSPWREQVRELARTTNVWCKVSGLITEANHTSWKPADFKPYLDVVFEAFGEDRVMYGSDWPVCLLAGSYERTFGLVDDYTRQLTRLAREKFFGGNAARFYRIRAGRRRRKGAFL